jgi:vitamin B12 transporter
VVTAKEIEQQQKRTVADALRMVPGLDVKRSGGSGTSTEVSLRGAKSEHTLVLIDGVEMNDQSFLGGIFDFGHLTTDNIERIEILRGPQSTLYGSQAMGGVINIITKRGDGKLKGFLSAEGGSHYTAHEAAGISGGSTAIQYSINVSRLDTDGISAAAARYGNKENDPYQNTVFSSRLGITPTNNLEIDFTLRYGRSRTASDLYNGLGGDDPNYISKTDELAFRGQGALSLFNGLWEQALGISFRDLTRSYDNFPDSLQPFDFAHNSYHGQTVKLDWQHVLKLHKTNTATLGLETKEENVRVDGYDSWGSSQLDERFVRTNALYLQDKVSLFDAWFSTLGVRIDDHSQFGTEATYRFTTAYLVKQTDTKIKGSYGTGFKAPSLYQLYAPIYGVSDLKPEKSNGWDIGLEQKIVVLKTTLSATWFKNEFTNLITMDWSKPWPWKYENTAKSHSQGLELTASVQPLEELRLNAGYTYTETKDDVSGKQLPYRPKNKASFDINYSFLKKANVNLGLVYVGTRYADTANTQKMKDYLLVNLAGSYDLTKNLQVFGRVDNLFDRQYEEVAGYGTPGIGAYGGVKVSF